MESIAAFTVNELLHAIPAFKPHIPHMVQNVSQACRSQPIVRGISQIQWTLNKTDKNIAHFTNIIQITLYSTFWWHYYYSIGISWTLVLLMCIIIAYLIHCIRVWLSSTMKKLHYHRDRRVLHFLMPQSIFGLVLIWTTVITLITIFLWWSSACNKLIIASTAFNFCNVTDALNFSLTLERLSAYRGCIY